MPTSVDRLTEGSVDAQVDAAISDCIATEVNAGTPQDQAIAMCHQMVRDKTGRKPIPKEEVSG